MAYENDSRVVRPKSSYADSDYAKMEYRSIKPEIVVLEGCVPTSVVRRVQSVEAKASWGRSATGGFFCRAHGVPSRLCRPRFAGSPAGESEGAAV